MLVKAKATPAVTTIQNTRSAKRSVWPAFPAFPSTTCRAAALLCLLQIQLVHSLEQRDHALLHAGQSDNSLPHLV